ACMRSFLSNLRWISSSPNPNSRVIAGSDCILLAPHSIVSIPTPTRPWKMYLSAWPLVNRNDRNGEFQHVLEKFWCDCPYCFRVVALRYRVDLERLRNKATTAGTRAGRSPPCRSRREFVPAGRRGLLS